MKHRDFALYKGQYRSAIRTVLAGSEAGRLDEAAFPAYSHPSRIINWLFWQRIRKAIDHIGRYKPYDRVLDFGCGSGVMLPFLASVGKEVVAFDVDLVPIERVREHVEFPGNIELVNANMLPLQRFPASSYELVVALDVLEHVADLSGTIDALLCILKPGGQLLVSGPTENIIYRLGRRMAGPEYSGDYHVRGTSQIKTELARRRPVNQVAALYWPVPLFEIFCVTK